MTGMKAEKWQGITAADFPAGFRPGRGLNLLAWAGMAFLVLFGLAFIWSRWAA